MYYMEKKKSSRFTYKIINDSFLSGLTLLLGVGLFFLISIETFLFRVLSSFFLLNIKSEWYIFLEFIPYTLIFLPYLFLFTFYLSRWSDNFSLSVSYHYSPPIFGSKRFRRLMRVFLVLHLNIFGETVSSPGGGYENFDEIMTHSHSMLFCLIVILISRLIERDNNSDTTEITENTKSSD